ncbi:uncharacterized protein N7487_000388 [Penicillium crustosum]|uniref:uncharacterized protein n=1 Tax=Penicillium crustosum TaxID=36656 RepID=UPI00238614C4|nr:uncharacterized protein N7487_000388 [Penicillium crustosum]KAJ5416838.1 hypothetical protein N7487_000388 [Penicillium crustosum]
MMPLKKCDQFSVPDMPDNREDIIVQAEPGVGECTCPRSRGLKNLLFPFFSVLFPIFYSKVSTKKNLHAVLNSEPPPTSLYHTLTATCSVALMCLAPSIFTSQDYISDHLWKANIN